MTSHHRSRVRYVVSVGGKAVAGLAAALSLGSQAAQAQGDPVMEAQQEYRSTMVHIVEETLFNITQKTTTVVYLKELRRSDSDTLYCGAALFGSRPQKFIISTSIGAFVRAPTASQWADDGCAADGFKTLIDLR